MIPSRNIPIRKALAAALSPRAYAAGAAIAGPAIAQPAAQPADLVAINGKVFTARDGGGLAQGFAVTGDRFIAVGSSEAMRAHVGAKPRSSISPAASSRRALRTGISITKAAAPASISRQRTRSPTSWPWSRPP